MKKQLIILAVFSLGRSLFATPTGLNNIPTADTVPHRTVAVQSFSSFGDGANQFAANGPGEFSYWMGFKAGYAFPFLNLEVGLDSPLAPKETGPLLFQTKVNANPWENGVVAVGVANVALTDPTLSGKPFTYAMLAHDFQYVRAHAGYGLQTNGNTVLVGVDRTWRVWGRSLNINADIVQGGNQSFWLPALGVKFDPTDYLVLEGWSNFPERGQPSHIAKINLVFHV